MPSCTALASPPPPLSIPSPPSSCLPPSRPPPSKTYLHLIRWQRLVLWSRQRSQARAAAVQGGVVALLVLLHPLLHLPRLHHHHPCFVVGHVGLICVSVRGGGGRGRDIDECLRLCKEACGTSQTEHQVEGDGPEERKAAHHSTLLALDTVSSSFIGPLLLLFLWCVFVVGWVWSRWHVTGK